jgi:hypothetical protein
MGGLDNPVILERIEDAQTARSVPGGSDQDSMEKVLTREVMVGSKMRELYTATPVR